MDRGAATADWERLRADVRRLIGRRAPTPDDAEDIAQEVLARVWRHSTSLRDDERFTAWVRRIVDNTLMDHLRVRQRHPLVRDPSTPEQMAPSEEIEGNVPAVKDHVAAVIRPFVEALPEPYRETLILSELEGLSHAEIARRTGVSVSGIKSRVQRGRVLLREALSRCCEMGLDARNTVVSCELRDDATVPEGCCEEQIAERAKRSPCSR
jgi:RNA polymerase sigma-70 factor (ECF subfamily)